jgi:ketosteroid isomerase-like protein
LELSEVVDRLEIMELCARYNRAAQAWDADGFVACFTPDGVFVRAHLGTRVEGVDALRAMIETGAASGLPASYHLTTDFLIAVDGDRAAQTCQILLYGFDPAKGGEGPNVIRGVGHFEDALVRTREGWRFRERVGWITAPDQRPVPIGRAREHLS